jgi:hypothetical protein
MKRKTLTTAVLAGLTGVAGMVSVSNAVNLNPDGLGQVLLYPYYSARGGNDTLISIVNTTDNAKSVKVRFLEALNSREVLDFNLYMSEYDVWVAAITDTDDEGGTLVIPDSSCTVPYFFGAGSFADETARFGSVDFVDFAYTGPNDDNGPQGIERTASGYIEVIEMGTLVDITNGSATAATHVLKTLPGPGGSSVELPRPVDCQQLVTAWTTTGGGAPLPGGVSYWVEDRFVDHEEPSGGLFGAGSIINPEEGTMFSYTADAIDAFSTAVLHFEPGDIRPNLNQGDTISNVFINGFVDTQEWQTSVEAVGATILYDTVMNEYALGGMSNGQSEWVVNFPTKNFYVDPGLPSIATAPVPPFTTVWDGEACEPVDFQFWDREEAPSNPVIQPPIISPPPPNPPGSGPFTLCYEANVLRFANSTDGVPDIDIPEFSEILKEPRFATILMGEFSGGWLRFDFNPGDTPVHFTRPTADNISYLGLPTIGFWVNTYTNGNTGAGVLANYGGTFKHRGSRALAPAVTAP